jgi:hypothetical protein
VWRWQRKSCCDVHVRSARQILGEEYIKTTPSDATYRRLPASLPRIQTHSLARPISTLENAPASYIDLESNAESLITSSLFNSQGRDEGVYPSSPGLGQL